MVLVGLLEGAELPKHQIRELKDIGEKLLITLDETKSYEYVQDNLSPDRQEECPHNVKCHICHNCYFKYSLIKTH